MKTLHYLFPILFIFVLDLFTACNAQTDDNSVFYPETSYEVHRKYDKEGNLIYYDSVSVSALNNDSSIVAIDSVFDAWEYGTPNRLRPFYYGFHFPGGSFGYIPEFEFNFVIPDYYDFNEGFEYDFSVSPYDSLHSQILPDDSMFYHRHVMPPDDWELYIDEQIYRMQQYIEELNRNMDEYFINPRFPESEHYNHDSIEESEPEPSESSYKYDGINI